MSEPMDPLTWSILAAAITTAYLTALKLSRPETVEQPQEAGTQPQEPPAHEPEEPVESPPNPAENTREQEADTGDGEKGEEAREEKEEAEEKPEPEIELIENPDPSPSLQPILQTAQDLQQELRKLQNLIKTQKS